MFESIIQQSQSSRRSVRSVILLTAIALHAVVLGAALAQNYFSVPDIAEPPLLVEFLQLEPPPPPPPPPAAGVPAEPTPQPTSEPEPEVTSEPEVPDLDVIAEPVEIAMEVNLDRQPDTPFIPADLIGDPRGVEGGVGGGVPSGVGTGRFPDLDAPILDPEIPARCVKRVKPRYPDLARMSGLQGHVILRAIILKDGKVADIEVVRELPMGCTQAAVDALRQWRYEPARQNGVPVTTILEVTIQFVLEG